MLIDGGWAEVEAGGEHLYLYSEHNALGFQASVYDVKTRNWIAPSESVDDVEQGRVESGVGNHADRNNLHSQESGS